MNSYTVLVTGGRDFNTRAAVFSDLDKVLAKHPGMEVWSGMALGADQLAFDYACFNGLDYRGFAAKWQDDGDSAGPRRNKRMMDAGPSLVVAFPGGRGTQGCVDLAKAAGVPLWDRREFWTRVLKVEGGVGSGD